MLRGIGEVAPRLLGCLNSLPSTRKEREANKDAAKKALMYPMRALAEEISKPRILRAFMMKAVFDSDRVDYLAILPHEIDQIMTNIDGKYFHVFDAKEAVDAICKHIKVENSKARGRGQYDDQKVVFWDKYNIGEIEVRTDKFHYGRIKMWFDARRVLDMLNVRIPETSHEYRRLILYGKARRLKI